MDEIRFFVNRNEVLLKESTHINLLEFLRDELAITGTKEGCLEGDCGACTVAIGEFEGNQIKYKAVNSCLYPIGKLNGKHVITVEGLADKGKLHPVQKALVDTHGTQCGFCTPGFVMSIFCLFLENQEPTRQEILDALEGNLCRCTGYKSILKAAENLANTKIPAKQLLPDYVSAVLPKLKKIKVQSVEIKLNNSSYFVPIKLSDYFQILKKLKKQTFKIVNGGTDFMVEVNVKGAKFQNIIDISNINELKEFKISKDKIIIGANINYSTIISNSFIRQKLPALYDSIYALGSRQIRNVATVVGNLTNASPIADTVPVLMALNSNVVVKGKNQQKKIPIRDFYTGYKKIKITNNEIVSQIEIPIGKNKTSFLKSAKRKSVDISSVNSAFSIVIGKENLIKDASFAFGGVGPVPLYLKKTSQYLKGKKISDEIIDKASLIALSEVKPISDVRGSEKFRNLLVRNHVIKHIKNLNGK